MEESLGEEIGRDAEIGPAMESHAAESGPAGGSSVAESDPVAESDLVAEIGVGPAAVGRSGP